jgi:hypothetical protein
MLPESSSFREWAKERNCRKSNGGNWFCSNARAADCAWCELCVGCDGKVQILFGRNSRASEQGNLLAPRAGKLRIRWRIDGVRWIVGIALLLIATGWLACEFESPAGEIANRPLVSQWRRTVDGWERLVPASSAADVKFDALTECHPHPIILSLLEGMISVLVLVAFSSDAVSVGGAAECEELAIAETGTQGETGLSAWGQMVDFSS